MLRYRLGQALLFVGPFATLAINPWGNFDPISVVKLAAISTMAFLILFLILSNMKIAADASRALKLSSGLFFLFLVTSFLFSGAPMDQQFWGVFGRNTGLLAYVSLGIILFATAIMRDSHFFSLLVNALLFTGIPMTLYCLVQISGNDPIGWSSFEAFGTLGNINFLSAFLGLVCVAAFAFVVDKKTKVAKRVLLLALLVTDLYIVQSTGSIQGVFVFGVGVVVILFLRLKTDKLINVRQAVFSLLVIAAAIPTLAGLANKGPLASVLFQNSTVLRTDYWHAGLEMTQNRPLFGVGMDSYGDWYREARGEISTLRGSPDRTANTAHNIFLDLSSNGGIPLLLAYLALLVLALKSSVKSYKRTEGSFDPVFAAMLAAWVGYQVQALVSINQLGVGIWGWLFTGALIGYGELMSSSDGNSKRSLQRKAMKTKLLPAFSALMGFTGICLGFLLVWFPLNADSRYFSASKSGDWARITSSVDSLGSTAWHLARTAETAYQNQAFDQSLEQAEKLIDRYPRDFGGWRFILYLPNSSPEAKAQAFSKLHDLDPFNPEFIK